MNARLAFLLLFLAGCGTSPETRFFELEPVPGGRPPGTVPAAPLTVNAVHLPPVLDRLEIVQRGTQGSVVINGTDRWAAPLDQMARRVLARDLAVRLGSGRVIEPDAPRPGGPVLGLVVVMQEFGADASGDVVLEGEWTVLAGSLGEPALREHERVVVASRGRNQAVGMSEALGLLADRIVARLASHPAPGRQRGAT